jgi:hypothetical protein
MIQLGKRFQKMNVVPEEAEWRNSTQAVGQWVTSVKASLKAKYLWVRKR